MANFNSGLNHFGKDVILNDTIKSKFVNLLDAHHLNKHLCCALICDFSEMFIGVKSDDCLIAYEISNKYN